MGSFWAVPQQGNFFSTFHLGQSEQGSFSPTEGNSFLPLLEEETQGLDGNPRELAAS